MHGYKKPKNEWSKKKKRNKFSDYDDFNNENTKKNKKNKAYYRVRDGVTDNEYEDNF
jgi:helix-turn-helix protein